MLFGLSACAGRGEPKPTRAVQPQLARAHWVTADGTILPVRSWWPTGRQPTAIIVALHGFNDYGRAFEPPGRFLSQKGVAVIAYDQRGFGNAPGRGWWAGAETYASDLLAVIGQIRRRYPGLPVFVLGESMGGAVAMVALTDRDAPGVSGLILSAPAVWSRDMMPWYQRAVLALFSATLPDLELTGSGLKIQASDNIAMLRALGRDPLVIKGTRVDAIEGLANLMDLAQARAPRLRIPTLVLYGERDQVIPRPPIDALLAKLPRRPDSRMAIYPQGYHLLLRDLQARLPLEDMLGWIADRNARLKSGLELRPNAGQVSGGR
ncbi:MAG: alpha/beta hydrolase [Methylococcus sp.]|nr:MAG: alpha/beta hydrolase [Methylococcus sp.]